MGKSFFKLRDKQVKYKNDKERALVLQNYSNSISEPGSKKFFGGTAFNKLKSPAKNKSKETVKSFNTWLQNVYVADSFNKAFSGDF